ncbi:hypothetical protein HETIRDRAFT_167587 [Heterobasidion irregulare TC 32-1]|uniref:Uncharacterized protein n=1 Tax=Heterobasidion irregulare (strain TC 32-1) TaxID=747525 RepID=W4KKD7_HETIT|nr:uncharacterized protein HETIRDRAFT_167587 [Heterobasidion irregulare TC 32-1]ETW86189.1 hypothetical protein HETIRDRAFT_167587 [Heterobasidion irregulare TC 32-1]
MSCRTLCCHVQFTKRTGQCGGDTVSVYELLVIQSLEYFRRLARFESEKNWYSFDYIVKKEWAN